MVIKCLVFPQSLHEQFDFILSIVGVEQFDRKVQVGQPFTLASNTLLDNWTYLRGKCSQILNLSLTVFAYTTVRYMPNADCVSVGLQCRLGIILRLQWYTCNRDATVAPGAYDVSLSFPLTVTHMQMEIFMLSQWQAHSSRDLTLDALAYQVLRNEPSFSGISTVGFAGL